jgi:hypothetical protein
MKTSRIAGRAFAAVTALTLIGCDIPNPTENVNVRLEIVDARVKLDAIGALPLVPGQVIEHTATVKAGSSIRSLDTVQAIRLDPASLTYTHVAGDTKSAAPGGVDANGAVDPSGAAGANGSVLVALRTDNRPLLAAIVTVTDGVVTAIDPAVASLPVAVDRIRAHAATAAQHLAGADARLGDWQSLTAASLLQTLESVLASQSTGITLVVMPLSGNLSGSLGVAEFSVHATVTTRR